MSCAGSLQLFLSGPIEANAQIKGEPAAKIDRGILCCDILR